MQPPTPCDFVFTENTFEPAFRQEILRAEKYIFIESAYITVSGVQRFIDDFEKAIRRRVRICAFIQSPRNWKLRNSNSLEPSEQAELEKVASGLKLLRKVGVHVTLRARTHLKLVVIDGQRVYKGSLNILSYTHHTDEEMDFWTDPQWAQHNARRRRLHQCDECRKLVAPLVAGIVVPFDAIGRGVQMKTLRQRAGFTQQQLADAVGVSKRTVVRLERGGSVDTGLFFRIFEAINKRVVIVPPQLMPWLNAWLPMVAGSKD